MRNAVPTIVVVDDTSSVRSMFERSSAPLDIQLKTFASAAESMSYLATAQPELLFLDDIMPEKDGMTFLEELRRNTLHKHTPVIIISTKDYAQDRTVARQLGALEYVVKPVGMQTIKDLIVKYTRAATKKVQSSSHG
ncbi:MAG: response regulator [Gammaproteobacteria bacterium]|nr:response regulator [Gammaproteobacteria bacterium]MCI0591055.1 response regulator [Gammaproteobacteria bacterium]